MTITFNRPDKLNAVRGKTLREFDRALDDAAGRDEVRVVLLTGAGRGFCAGQDLAELDQRLGRNTAAEDEARLWILQDLTGKVIAHPKTIIAALNGVAVGFGAEISLAADLRIASEAARIGFVEVTRGLAPTGGITWLLPRVVGHGAAADLLLTGEIVPAERALALGLVTRLFSAADFRAEAQAFAQQVAANAPVSMQIVRDALRLAWRQSLDDALHTEVRGMLDVMTTDDLVAGTAAFLARRPAEYRGH